MSWVYLFCPFLGWVIAGTLKSVIRGCRGGLHEIGKIGPGGFPSNHTTVVASVTALIAFDQGVHSPVFGLALAVLIIIIFDAIGLRKQVGEHAELLNRSPSMTIVLRESLGHTWVEVVGGAILGLVIGFGLYEFGQMLD